MYSEPFFVIIQKLSHKHLLHIEYQSALIDLLMKDLLGKGEGLIHDHGQTDMPPTHDRFLPETS